MPMLRFTGSGYVVAGWFVFKNFEFLTCFCIYHMSSYRYYQHICSCLFFSRENAPGFPPPPLPIKCMHYKLPGQFEDKKTGKWKKIPNERQNLVLEFMHLYSFQVKELLISILKSKCISLVGICACCFLYARRASSLRHSNWQGQMAHFEGKHCTKIPEHPRECLLTRPGSLSWPPLSRQHHVYIYGVILAFEKMYHMSLVCIV